MSKNNSISYLSDEELLLSHKTSEKKNYIEELFLRYLPLIYGVCLKYLKDSKKAGDAVMQLFDDLRYNISDFEIDVFRPWMYNVVKNHCFRILQNEEQHVVTDFNDETLDSADIIHLFERKDNGEQTATLTEYMNKLPERQRVSLNYFFTDELSYAEIVKKTGYTLKNVRSYIQSGKRQLKTCIENNNQ